MDAPPAEEVPGADAGPEGGSAVLVQPPGEHDVQHLDCTMNRHGDGLVIWRQRDLDMRASQVWASRLARGGSAWSPAEVLSPMTGAELDLLSTAVDDQGRMLAVWNSSGADQPAGVMAARRLPGAAWAPPTLAGAGWMLDLVSSPGGAAAAVGVVEGTPPTLLRFSPTAGWAADPGVRLERPGFFFASPLGDGLLVWNQAAASGHELWQSGYRPDAGDSFTAPARLHEAQPFDHPLPLVNAALAADGAGLLVWNRGGDVQGSIWASARPPGGAWQPPHRLMGDGEAPLWTTAVVVNEGGDGLVAWSSGTPPGWNIWVTLRTGGTLQPTTAMGVGSDVAVAARSPAGAAVVGWSTNLGIFGRRFAPGAGWGPLRAFFDNRVGVADICAAIDDAGHAWILWIGSSPQVVKAFAID